MEDLPNSVDLKSFLLSDLSHGVSGSSARSLGRSLGSWLRSFHKWATKHEQAGSRSLLAQTGAMKNLKFYINYSMLIDTITNFPHILEETRGVFEEVKSFAAAEMTKSGENHGFGIIHGDFWTGK